MDKDCYSFGMDTEFSSPPQIYRNSQGQASTPISAARQALNTLRYVNDTTVPATNWATRAAAGTATALTFPHKYFFGADKPTWGSAYDSWLNQFNPEKRLSTFKPGTSVRMIQGTGSNATPITADVTKAIANPDGTVSYTYGGTTHTASRVSPTNTVTGDFGNKATVTYGGNTYKLDPDNLGTDGVGKANRAHFVTPDGNEHIYVNSGGQIYDGKGNQLNLFENRNKAGNKIIGLSDTQNIAVNPKTGEQILDAKVASLHKPFGKTKLNALNKLGMYATIGNMLGKPITNMTGGDYDSLSPADKAKIDGLTAGAGATAGVVGEQILKRLPKVKIPGTSRVGEVLSKVKSLPLGKVGKFLGKAAPALNVGLTIGSAIDTFTKPDEYWDTKKAGKYGKYIRTALDGISTGAAFFPPYGTIVSLGTGGLNMLGQAFNLWSSDNDQINSYVSGEHINYSRYDDIMDDITIPYANFSLESRVAQHKQSKHYKNVAKSMDKIIKSSMHRIGDASMGFEDENSSADALQNMVDKAKSSADSARQIVGNTKTLGKNYRHLLSIIRKSGDPNGDRKDKLLTAGISLGMTRQGILNDYESALNKKNKTNGKASNIPQYQTDLHNVDGY